MADLIIKVKQVCVDLTAVCLRIRYQLTCVPATQHPINHLFTCNTTSNHMSVTIAAKHSNQSLPEYMEHSIKSQMFSITQHMP